MCLMITHCSKCGYEIDESRRMADNDEPTTEFNEENGLPEDHVEGRDEETMECMCMEVDHFHDGGRYTVSWDGLDTEGKPLSSGVYLLRLQALGRVETRKMMLMK